MSRRFTICMLVSSNSKGEILLMSGFIFCSMSSLSPDFFLALMFYNLPCWFILFNFPPLIMKFKCPYSDISRKGLTKFRFEMLTAMEREFLSREIDELVVMRVGCFYSSVKFLTCEASPRKRRLLGDRNCCHFF